MKLADCGEDRLLDELLRRLPSNGSVVVPAGDDCAVVQSPTAGKLLLLKTDCVVQGVHFTAQTAAADVGWKAMARPLSDFAAMSGVPQWALITVALPTTATVAWTKLLYRGLARAARMFDVAIVGGETSRTRGAVVISVAVGGSAEKHRWVSRRGGRPNDQLFVTGRLGGSIGGRHLRFVPRIKEARWLTEHFPIHAMMDLSDGLGADLPRLAGASGVGFELDESGLPKHRGVSTQSAIADGEDYELLFAVAPNVSAELQARWAKRWCLKLTPIGRLTTKKKLQRLTAGYDHFA